MPRLTNRAFVALVITALPLLSVAAGAGTLSFRIPLKGLLANSSANGGSATGPVITTGNIAFGGIPTSTTSAGQSATITNAGGPPFTITQVTSTTPYSVTQNCVGQVLSVGQTCTATVTYRPTASGSNPGTVTFTTSASSATIGVSGYGGTPGLSAASTLDLGATPYNTWTQQVALPITNTGTVPIHPTLKGMPAGYVTTTSNCPTIDVGATCTEYVSERVLSVGSNQGDYVQVTSEAGTAKVVLSVFGIAYSDTIDKTSLMFGTLALGSTSAPQYLTITNTGNWPDTISAPNPVPGFQVVSNTCTTIPVGGSCTIGVIFAPTAKISYYANMWIQTSAQKMGPSVYGTGS